MHLVQEINKAEEPSRVELAKLRNLIITLTHEVPPQHEIESCAGSHALTKEEAQQFEQIIPMKKGVYDPDEDRIIAHNWKTFCKLHDWNKKNVTPFLLLRQTNRSYIRNKRQRKRFVQFLANGLPRRSLYSVYHRFRTLYEPRVQRRYDPEEDQIILTHIENNPNLENKRKYADLAKILRRTRGSIWRRYRILTKKRKLKEDEI